MSDQTMTSLGLEPAALWSHWGTRILSISVVMLSSHLCAADDGSRSGAEHVQKGNEYLAAGNYNEALASYDRAREKLPDAAEVAYDRGVALYRLGRLAEAETAFQDALRPDSPELESKAKYNLGRCSHAAALAEQKDLPRAINDLGRAIGFYKDALQVRPDDADAKQNVAIAERLQSYLKKRLAQQQEEKKEPSSQPGDKKQDEDESDGDDQQQGDDQQEGRDDQKQSDEDGEEQESDEQQPSSQPNEDESPSTQPSEKPPEEPTTQSATQPSEEAATQPMTAASQPTSQPEDPEAARRRMSIEQAMRMLQEARDAELQRREKRRAQKMRRRGRIPVDKDW